MSDHYSSEGLPQSDYIVNKMTLLNAPTQFYIFVCPPEIVTQVTTLGRNELIVWTLTGVGCSVAILSTFLFLLYMIRVRNLRTLFGFIGAFACMGLSFATSVQAVNVGGFLRGAHIAARLFTWISQFFIIASMYQRVALVIPNPAFKHVLGLLINVVHGLYATALIIYTIYRASKYTLITRIGTFAGAKGLDAYYVIFPVVLALCLHASFIIYGYLYIVPNEKKALLMIPARNVPNPPQISPPINPKDKMKDARFNNPHTTNHVDTTTGNESEEIRVADISLMKEDVVGTHTGDSTENGTHSIDPDQTRSSHTSENDNEISKNDDHEVKIEEEERPKEMKDAIPKMKCKVLQFGCYLIYRYKLHMAQRRYKKQTLKYERANRAARLKFLFDAATFCSFGTMIDYILLLVFEFYLVDGIWFVPVLTLIFILSILLEFMGDHFVLIKQYAFPENPNRESSDTKQNSGPSTLLSNHYTGDYPNTHHTIRFNKNPTSGSRSPSGYGESKNSDDSIRVVNYHHHHHHHHRRHDSDENTIYEESHDSHDEDRRYSDTDEISVSRPIQKIDPSVYQHLYISGLEELNKLDNDSGLDQMRTRKKSNKVNGRFTKMFGSGSGTESINKNSTQGSTTASKKFLSTNISFEMPPLSSLISKSQENYSPEQQQQQQLQQPQRELSDAPPSPTQEPLPLHRHSGSLTSTKESIQFSTNFSVNSPVSTTTACKRQVYNEKVHTGHESDALSEFPFGSPSASEQNSSYNKRRSRHNYNDCENLENIITEFGRMEAVDPGEETLGSPPSLSGSGIIPTNSVKKEIFLAIPVNDASQDDNIEFIPELLESQQLSGMDETESVQTNSTAFDNGH